MSKGDGEVTRDMEWVKDLKPGDEVAVDKSGVYTRNSYQITKVEKITPTGRIKLYDGSQYYPNGRELGQSYSYPLKKITPEILEIIKRRDLMYKIKDVQKLIGSLSSERLEILLQWQAETKVE